MSTASSSAGAGRPSSARRLAGKEGVGGASAAGEFFFFFFQPALRPWIWRRGAGLPEEFEPAEEFVFAGLAARPGGGVGQGGGGRVISKISPARSSWPMGQASSSSRSAAKASRAACSAGVGDGGAAGFGPQPGDPFAHLGEGVAGLEEGPLRRVSPVGEGSGARRERRGARRGQRTAPEGGGEVIAGEGFEKDEAVAQKLRTVAGGSPPPSSPHPPRSQDPGVAHEAEEGGEAVCEEGKSRAASRRSAKAVSRREVPSGFEDGEACLAKNIGKGGGRVRGSRGRGRGLRFVFAEVGEAGGGVGGGGAGGGVAQEVRSAPGEGGRGRVLGPDLFARAGPIRRRPRLGRARRGGTRAGGRRAGGG